MSITVSYTTCVDDTPILRRYVASLEAVPPRDVLHVVQIEYKLLTLL